MYTIARTMDLNSAPPQPESERRNSWLSSFCSGLRLNCKYLIPDILLDIPKHVAGWRRKGPSATWRWLVFWVSALVAAWLLEEFVQKIGWDFVTNALVPWLLREKPRRTWLVALPTLVGVAALFGYWSRGKLLDQRARDLDAATKALAEKNQEVGQLRERLQEFEARVNREGTAFPEQVAKKLLGMATVHQVLLLELDIFREASAAKAVAWWEVFVSRMLLHLCDMYGHDLVNHGSVLLPAPDGQHLRVSRGSRVGPESLAFRKLYCGEEPGRDHERGVAGTVFAECTSRYARDVVNSKFHVPLEGRPPSYQDVLSAPIGSEAPPLGVLSIESDREVFQRELDLHFLQTVADIIASALRVLASRGIESKDLIMNGSDLEGNTSHKPAAPKIIGAGGGAVDRWQI